MSKPTITLYRNALNYGYLWTSAACPMNRVKNKENVPTGFVLRFMAILLFLAFFGCEIPEKLPEPYKRPAYWNEWPYPQQKVWQECKKLNWESDCNE